jgi:hypothetical protein
MPIPTFLKGLFSGGASKIVDSVKDVIDEFNVSGEEKAKIQQALIDSTNKHLEAMETEANKLILAEQEAITDRWKSDMSSDSWWSKNIRPIVLGSLFAFWFLIVIFDSSIKEYFEVKDTYIEATKYLLDIVVIAYFGSRGAEKVIPQFKKK